MKLYVFGSGAGIAPETGWHHTSFAIERGGDIYWFDAGENCSFTAHTMGVDLKNVRKVFISHTHMDHVGGLGNLFWNIRKLTLHADTKYKAIELFIPRLEVWNGIYAMLRHTEGGFNCRFSVNAHEYDEGLLFEENGFSASALRNHHLNGDGDEKWLSFGFEIKEDGARYVYTGDCRDIADMTAMLTEKTDIVFAETGHHEPEAVCEALFAAENAPEKIFFIHSGVALRRNKDGIIEKLAERYGDRVRVLRDGDELRIQDTGGDHYGGSACGQAQTENA